MQNRKSIKRGKKAAKLKSEPIRVKIKKRIPEKELLASDLSIFGAQPKLISYEEAMLHSIISNEKKNKTTEYAVLFNSILSNLTINMRDLYYKLGISIGRALYRMYEGRRRYLWYEESVADLVSFFESVGYKSVSYNIFPNMVRINIHEQSRLFLGSNMHVFEAGIMSGFLTAAKGQLVYMSEIACSHNNSDYCHFQSFGTPQLASEQVVDSKTISNFIDYVSANINTQHKAEMLNEYHMLSGLALLDRTYINHVEQIMVYLGREFGRKLKISKSRKSDINKIERVISLLNLGRPKIKSLKPLEMQIYFDKVNSKREFVDLSIAFLNGLVSDSMDQSRKVEVTGINKAGIYEIDLKENKQAND